MIIFKQCKGIFALNEMHHTVKRITGWLPIFVNHRIGASCQFNSKNRVVAFSNHNI